MQVQFPKELNNFLCECDTRMTLKTLSLLFFALYPTFG